MLKNLENGSNKFWKLTRNLRNTVKHSPRSASAAISLQVHLGKPKEVKSIIRSLKNWKSPGQDGIRNTCHKHLPRKALVALTKILNVCLVLGYFPVEANKDITNPINQINRYLGTDEVIPHEQFGFKLGNLTSKQLTDSVWQDAVVYKLFRPNLQPYLVKIVESFLSNRSFTVMVRA